MITCYWCTICLRIWNQDKNLRFLVPNMTYLKKKSFPNILLVFLSVILLISMILSRSGGGEGDANFFLKCHALFPNCLTFFVVHFWTFIYVSIFKGTVSRELRPMLLYIIQKLFSRPIVTLLRIFILLKGQFTMYIKPFSVS